ncbi:CAP domain-containing protein [Frankia sp. CiP3]|uniref:CAP domain-containing protein n=1 Tax=Frankia sp. CiP3 TaxID=2880971 RepID=UPI001EF45BEA|nr:CAP domain-containing protein [Frankia sp. CiP3]
MIELVAGANRPLPGGVLSVRVPGPFDLSLLITGDDGQVAADQDFVFYNQPSAPGATVNGDSVTIDPGRLRPGASRVVVVVSPADSALSLGQLPVPVLDIRGGEGSTLVRFTPPRPRDETVFLLAEIYRRGGAWKIRALGQGYSDGLAGLVRDFGVQVDDDTAPLAGPLAEVVVLVNAERARTGAGPLASEPRLALAAQRHSEDMAANSYMDHVSLDGRTMSDRAAAAGYRYRMLGENVAAGQPGPAEVMAGWMNSPGHRKNILTGDFTQIGVGCARGGSYGVYWTQLFGLPADR